MGAGGAAAVAMERERGAEFAEECCSQAGTVVLLAVLVGPFLKNVHRPWPVASTSDCHIAAVPVGSLLHTASGCGTPNFSCTAAKVWLQCTLPPGTLVRLQLVRPAVPVGTCALQLIQPAVLFNNHQVGCLLGVLHTQQVMHMLCFQKHQHMSQQTFSRKWSKGSFFITYCAMLIKCITNAGDLPQNVDGCIASARALCMFT
jgi:hypothetical protein